MLENSLEKRKFILELNALKLPNIRPCDIKTISDSAWHHRDDEIQNASRVYLKILADNPTHTIETFKEIVSLLQTP